MLEKKAVFSPCRRYRYSLWREVNMFGSGICQFICLNPSTADEVQDDPTVRRCIDYTDRWGYRWFCMTNIFAWRDTDPEAMKLVPKPISHCKRPLPLGDGSMILVEENDYYISHIGVEAEMIVAAWGKHGDHHGRGESVKRMIRSMGPRHPNQPRLHYLKLNDDGSPQHPLYLSKELKPIPFP